MASSSTLTPTENKIPLQPDEMIHKGLMELFKPSVENLDSKVHKVRMSQEELSISIDAVSADLKSIAEGMPNPHDLDPHIKRLSNARRKVNIINSVLHNCQERLRKLHTHVLKETQKKEATLKQIQAINTAALDGDEQQQQTIQAPTTVESQTPTTVESQTPTTVESQTPTTVESQVPTTVESQAPTTVESQTTLTGIRAQQVASSDTNVQEPTTPNK